MSREETTESIKNQTTVKTFSAEAHEIARLRDWIHWLYSTTDHDDPSRELYLQALAGFRAPDA